MMMGDRGWGMEMTEWNRQSKEFSTMLVGTWRFDVFVSGSQWGRSISQSVSQQVVDICR